MPNHRNANIILGYLPKIDGYPKQAKHEKPLRFAIAFNCYYPSVAGHFFLDAELIANTCSKIIGSFSPQIIDDSHQTIEPASLETAIHRLENITIYENSHPVAWLNVRRWDCTGGPKDYHDRYTVEVFTSTKHFQAFLKSAKDALAQNKCKITAIEYPQIPVPLNILEKIKILFS